MRTMHVSNLPVHRRPREKLREKGGAALSDAELLAIVLRTGYRGKNAVEVAERLLRHQPLSRLLSQPMSELVKLKGIGPATAATFAAVWSIYQLLSQSDIHSSINQPESVWRICRSITHKQQEYLVALFLNARNQLIKDDIITIGTLNASLVHAREVFAPALELRAAGVIIAHNHPSGSLEPSQEDIVATEKLAEAGQIIDIPLLDHVIVTSSGWYSFKHHQLL